MIADCMVPEIIVALCGTKTWSFTCGLVLINNIPAFVWRYEYLCKPLFCLGPDSNPDSPEYEVQYLFTTLFGDVEVLLVLVFC
jgi:hypothetical protein